MTTPENDSLTADTRPLEARPTGSDVGDAWYVAGDAMDDHSWRADDSLAPVAREASNVEG